MARGSVVTVVKVVGVVVVVSFWKLELQVYLWVEPLNVHDGPDVVVMTGEAVVEPLVWAT